MRVDRIRTRAAIYRGGAFLAENIRARREFLNPKSSEFHPLFGNIFLL